MSKPNISPRELARRAHEDRKAAKLAEAAKRDAKQAERDARLAKLANDAAGKTLEASPLDEWFPGVEWQIESLSVLNGAVGRSAGLGVVVYPRGDEELKLLVQRPNQSVKPYVYSVELQRDSNDALFYGGTEIHSPADLGDVLEQRATFKAIAKKARA